MESAFAHVEIVSSRVGSSASEYRTCLPTSSRVISLRDSSRSRARERLRGDIGLFSRRSASRIWLYRSVGSLSWPMLSTKKIALIMLAASGIDHRPPLLVSIGGNPRYLRYINEVGHNRSHRGGEQRQ